MVSDRGVVHISYGDHLQCKGNLQFRQVRLGNCVKQLVDIDCSLIGVIDDAVRGLELNRHGKIRQRYRDDRSHAKSLKTKHTRRVVVVEK